MEKEEEARNDANGRRRLRAMGNGEKHIAQSVVVYNTSRAEEGPKDVIAPSAVYIDICVTTPTAKDGRKKIRT